MTAFWDKWFSPTTNEPVKKTPVTLAQAREKLEKRQSEAVTTWKKNQERRLREIQTLLDEIFNDLKPLSERNFLEEGENQFVRKVVQTSSQQFVNRMKQLIQKLDVPFTKTSLEQFRYGQQGHRVLAAELADFYKSVLYAGILAKSEMKNVGQKMDKLEQELLALEQSTQNVIPNATKGALSALAELESVQNQLQKVIAEKDELEYAYQKSEKLITQLMNEKKELQQNPAFIAIRDLEEQKNKIEQQRQELIQRPRRWVMETEKEFQKLFKSKQNPFSVEQQQKISHFMEQPENLFRSDPKGELLKEWFRLGISAMKQDAIAFKNEKEKQKTIQGFEKLEKTSFFDEYFWPINETERTLKELNEKTSGTSIIQRIKPIDQEIVSHQHQQTKIQNERELIQKRLTQLEKKQQDEREKLSLALCAVLNESVEVIG